MLRKRKRKIKIIAVFCLSFYILFGWSVSQTMADSDHIAMSLRVSAVPVEEEEELITYPPGGVHPDAIIPPTPDTEIFVQGEKGVPPYVKVLMVSDVKVIPDQPTQIYDRRPVFFSKTNIRNAIIFLEIDQQQVVYTTFADLRGVWQFSPPVFQELGWHTLYITAISPAVPKIQATEVFQYQIIPTTPPLPPQPPTPPLKPTPIPEPPEPITPPTPPEQPTIIPPLLPPEPPEQILPPTPLKPPIPPVPPTPPIPLDIIEDLFSLNLEVYPESKEIIPKEKIKIKVEVKRVIPIQVTRDIGLNFIIKDPQGNIIYHQDQFFYIKNAVAIHKKFKTSRYIKPGQYQVEVQIERDGVVYISLDTFEVKEVEQLAPISFMPAWFYDNFIKVFSIFIAFLIFFIILIWWEYRRSKLSEVITDDDLINKGFIR